VDLSGAVLSNARLDGAVIDGVPVADLLARWRDG
jgi:uncharacterized protein YjbI with pentapeptide repeats